MAGLPWIPLEVGFPTGPHAIALSVALGKPRAWSYAAQLWCWAADHQADGRFEGPAAVATVEAAAGWDGDPGKLVEVMALSHIGLLDVTERGFYIHNWHLHCGAHIEKREKDRVRHRVGGSKEPPRKLHGATKEVRQNSAHEKEREREKEKDQKHAPGKPAPPSGFKAAQDMVVAVFLEIRKAKYLWGGAKDTEGLKRLLSEPLAEIERRWRAGLTSQGWRETATVAQLAAKWNDLAASGPGPPASKVTGFAPADEFQPGVRRVPL